MYVYIHTCVCMCTSIALVTGVVSNSYKNTDRNEYFCEIKTSKYSKYLPSSVILCKLPKNDWESAYELYVWMILSDLV